MATPWKGIQQDSEWVKMNVLFRLEVIGIVKVMRAYKEQ